MATLLQAPPHHHHPAAAALLKLPRQSVKASQAFFPPSLSAYPSAHRRRPLLFSTVFYFILIFCSLSGKPRACSALDRDRDRDHGAREVSRVNSLSRAAQGRSEGGGGGALKAWCTAARRPGQRGRKACAIFLAKVVGWGGERERKNCRWSTSGCAPLFPSLLASLETDGRVSPFGRLSRRAKFSFLQPFFFF